MTKEAVFTMKLEPELQADFMAEAEAIQRPASQVLRELMREFVERQQFLARREYRVRPEAVAAAIVAAVRHRDPHPIDVTTMRIDQDALTRNFMTGAHGTSSDLTFVAASLP